MTDAPDRRWDELSTGEARALLEGMTADAPARLDTFLSSVRTMGGPADALDRSLGSLEILWPWFLEAAARREGERQADPPWWAPFHRPWVVALGSRGSILIDGLSEYFISCVVTHARGSRWTVGRLASTRRHPVLDIPGRGEMNYAVPLGFTVRALTDPLPADREQRALRRLAEIWLGLDEEHEALLASIAQPTPRWAVRAVDEGRFTHELSIEESVAHRESTRIGALLDALRGEPGIIEVIHEDRDIALLRAPELTDRQLSGIVERLWVGDSPPHGDSTSGVQ